MYNTIKLKQIHEYSDDDVVYEPPSELELDDIESYDKSLNTYIYGSPKDGIYTYLGNPGIQNNDESSDYTVDYYYSDQNNFETIHIFRTIKQEKFEKAFFPSIEYIDNIQKLQGISLIKLVEYSEREKWIHYEYVPGGTLYDSLKFGRQFNFSDRLNILNGIAYTMNFLHDKGISHLDIRLESIIVTISENNPVLADVDNLVHFYKTRSDYADQFLLYLDPFFEIYNNFVRADIYSYGIMMNLLISKNIQPLEKTNIENIKKAYEEFKNSNIKDDNLRLTTYLNAIGLELNKEASEESEKKLMDIAKRCLFFQIQSPNDILKELKSIETPGRASSSSDLAKEFALTEDDSHNRDFGNEKFRFSRSNLVIVEQSASNLNARDIWLINKRDQIKKKMIQQRAAEASLYATITNDFSLYESILQEETFVKNP